MFDRSIATGAPFACAVRTSRRKVKREAIVMADGTSFGEFCRRVGSVPLRSVLSEAFAAAGAFFLIYLMLLGPFLVIVIPTHWFVLNVLGVNRKVIAYGIWALCLVALLKERKAVFVHFGEWFGLLKKMPEFFGSFFVAALLVGIVSFVWLPLWLALGIFLAFDFLFAFLERMNGLGQKCISPGADALITASLQDLKLPRRTRDLFEGTLRTLLRIVSEDGPPKNDVRTQASRITSSISILAADIEYRHREAVLRISTGTSP
jgi:hypothetical protein